MSGRSRYPVCMLCLVATQWHQLVFQLNVADAMKSRYQPSHMKKVIYSITEPLFPGGNPQVMNDVIVSSPMRTEIKDRRPRDLNSMGSLGSLACWLQPFLISV